MRLSRCPYQFVCPAAPVLLASCKQAGRRVTTTGSKNERSRRAQRLARPRHHPHADRGTETVAVQSALFAAYVVLHDVVKGLSSMQELLAVEKTLYRLFKVALCSSRIRLLQSPAGISGHHVLVVSSSARIPRGRRGRGRGLSQRGFLRRISATYLPHLNSTSAAIFSEAPSR